METAPLYGKKSQNNDFKVAAGKVQGLQGADAKLQMDKINAESKQYMTNAEKKCQKI